MSRPSIECIHKAYCGIHYTRFDEALRSRSRIESLLAPITCARLVPVPHTHAEIRLQSCQRLIVSQPWMRRVPSDPRSLDGCQDWRDRCCSAARAASIASATKCCPYERVACWDCTDCVRTAVPSEPAGPHPLTPRPVRPPRPARTTTPIHRENGGAGRVPLDEAMPGQRRSADAHRNARGGSRCPG